MEGVNPLALLATKTTCENASIMMSTIGLEKGTMGWFLSGRVRRQGLLLTHHPHPTIFSVFYQKRGENCSGDLGN